MQKKKQKAAQLDDPIVHALPSGTIDESLLKTRRRTGRRKRATQTDHHIFTQSSQMEKPGPALPPLVFSISEEKAVVSKGFNKRNMWQNRYPMTNIDGKPVPGGAPGSGKRR